MAEEVAMESVADAPMDSIADEAPVEGAEQAQDAQAGDSGATTAPADANAPEGQQDAEKPAEPEDYKLEASEDFAVPQENLDSFTKACKEAGLSKKQAEAMLNWHKGFASDVSKLQAQQESAQIRQWQDEILKDPEIGGSHWKAAVADSRKALNAFDQDGKLRTLLKQMHADYHPDVVRVIARVGRAMGEDKFIGSRGESSGRERPLEERMWPNMTV